MIRFPTRLLAAVLLIFLFALPLAVHAEESLKPSKESLRLAWENEMAQSEDTALFKKEEDGISYQYKTTLFPYDGTAQVLNVLIEDAESSRYEYTLPYDHWATYVGMIEVKLPNLTEDMKKDYPDSLYIWDKLNRFYYDPKAKLWVPESKANKYFSIKEDVTEKNCIAKKEENKPIWSNLEEIATALSVPIIFLVILFYIYRKSFKTQKQIRDEYNANTAKSLAMQEESMQRQKDAIELQKEILEALRGKKD